MSTESIEASEGDLQWVADGGSKRVLDLVLRNSLGSSREISLIGKRLSSLPPAIVVEGGWTMLDLSENPGIDMSRLSQLDRLEILVLDESELSSFDIKLPAGLRRLSLWSNKLSSWPAGLRAAGASLNYLDLSYNQLTQVPDEVGALESLEQLELITNSIDFVSPAIGQLKKLERLALATNPALSTLPKEILDLPDNCALSLSSTALPESFQRAWTIADLRAVWSDLEGR